jgi:protein TonB
MHQAALRASSLGMSAALLGVALIAALTMSYTLPLFDAPEAIPVVSVRPVPPPEPPPVHRPRLTPPPMTEAAPTLSEAAPPLEDIALSFPDQIGVGPTLETITRPQWRRRPSDLQRYYPRRALTVGVEGEVMLDCLVRVDGSLICAVASETPAGWGFADAAQRIASAHRMAPATRNGVPVEGRYRMRVPFRVE